MLGKPKSFGQPTKSFCDLPHLFLTPSPSWVSSQGLSLTVFSIFWGRDAFSALFLAATALSPPPAFGRPRAAKNSKGSRPPPKSTKLSGSHLSGAESSKIVFSRSDNPLFPLHPVRSGPVLTLVVKRLSLAKPAKARRGGGTAPKALFIGCAKAGDAGPGPPEWVSAKKKKEKWSFDWQTTSYVQLYLHFPLKSPKRWFKKKKTKPKTVLFVNFTINLINNYFKHVNT